MDQINYYDVKLDPTARISPAASVFGSVTIGADVTVFDGAQLRGDDSPILVGAGTNIQENCVFHVSPENPLQVGERVTIGHGAILHSCIIEDDVLIGMGSVVMDGARIGRGAMVAAGALVLGGMEVPPGMVAMGSPAKVRRELSEEEYQHMIVDAAEEYIQVGKSMEQAGLLVSGQRAIEDPSTLPRVTTPENASWRSAQTRN